MDYLGLGIPPLVGLGTLGSGLFWDNWGSLISILGVSPITWAKGGFKNRAQHFPGHLGGLFSQAFSKLKGPTKFGPPQGFGNEKLETKLTEAKPIWKGLGF